MIGADGVTFYSSGSISNYTIQFEDDFATGSFFFSPLSNPKTYPKTNKNKNKTDCLYDISVLITFLPSQSTTTASRVATVFQTGTGAAIPIIRFDDVTSSCVSEESDGEIYLAVQPVEGLPDGYEVVDYLWEQTEGGEVECVERLVFLFLFFFFWPILIYFFCQFGTKLWRKWKCIHLLYERKYYPLYSILMGSFCCNWYFFLEKNSLHFPFPYNSFFFCSI